MATACLVSRALWLLFAKYLLTNVKSTLPLIPHLIGTSCSTAFLFSIFYLCSRCIISLINPRASARFQAYTSSHPESVLITPLMYSIVFRQRLICLPFFLLSILTLPTDSTRLFQSTYQTIPSPICAVDIVVTPDMGPRPVINRVADGEPGPYVYRPPQEPLDVDGYPVAPAGLELEQVHVYVRHGASNL